MEAYFDKIARRAAARAETTAKSVRPKRVHKRDPELPEDQQLRSDIIDGRPSAEDWENHEDTLMDAVDEIIIGERIGIVIHWLLIRPAFLIIRIFCLIGGITLLAVAYVQYILAFVFIAFVVSFLGLILYLYTLT